MGYEILVCLLGLVSGILLANKIPDCHICAYLFPLIAVFLTSLCWNPKGFRTNRYAVFSGLVGWVCFFCTGWILVTTSRFVPSDNLSNQHEIAAKVVSYRKINENLGQLLIKVKYEKVDSLWQERTGKLVLLVKPDRKIDYEPGDLWLFGPMSITAISKQPSKNGFVPSRYWLSKGARFEAQLLPGRSFLARQGRLPSAMAYFGRWQQTLSERIDRLPLSENSKGMVKALVFGDQSDISSVTRNEFSKAGIIHVLSVSGLHVGIIYLIISWILKRVAFIGFRTRSFFGLVAVWLYSGLSGMSPSVLRSAGMISLFELARMGRRGTNSMEVLFSTALIHCLIDPYVVFSAGAQLSYLAVAGIFIWNPLVRPLFSKSNRVVKYLGESVSISLTAQSLIVPVLLFWFGWVPVYFLIGNLVLLPPMVFAFYLGLIITVLDFTGWSVPFLCKIMDFVIFAVEKGAGWLGNLPGNLLKPDGLVWADLVLYYLILLSLRSYWEKPDPRMVKRVLAGAGAIFLIRLI